MTRHARNCTAGAVYTYHEKKKDASASGYGTNTQRVGKDSVKDFDCCCLTLQPCREPVVTYILLIIYYLLLKDSLPSAIFLLILYFIEKMVISLIKKRY